MQTMIRVVAVLARFSFVWISLILISMVLIATNLHRQEVDAQSRYYSTFFMLAINEPNGIHFKSLYSLASYQQAHPEKTYSFLLPQPAPSCAPYICYTVLEDRGETQLIEVVDDPDSPFAFKTYSRYEASVREVRPVSLHKVSFEPFAIMFMGLLLITLSAKILLFILRRISRYQTRKTSAES